MTTKGYLVTLLLLASFLQAGCESSRRGGDDDDSGPTDDYDIGPQLRTNQMVASEDAAIRRLGLSGDSSNYGYQRHNNAQEWTNSNSAAVQQSLIKFDLSGIPGDAENRGAQSNGFNTVTDEGRGQPGHQVEQKGESPSIWGTKSISPAPVSR